MIEEGIVDIYMYFFYPFWCWNNILGELDLVVTMAKLSCYHGYWYDTDYAR